MARVPKHAAIVREALRACRKHLRAYVTCASRTGHPLRVTSVGGGPASDLIGLLDHLHSRDQPAAVRFTVLDGQCWQPFWDVIQEELRQLRFSVEVQYRVADATDRSFQKAVPPDTKLFVFSYFMVEMIAAHDKFVRVFTALVRQSRVGTLFLSVDPPRVSRTGYKKRLVEKCGGLLEVLRETQVTCSPPCPLWGISEPRLCGLLPRQLSVEAFEASGIFSDVCLWRRVGPPA
eukprot:RCo009644